MPPLVPSTKKFPPTNYPRVNFTLLAITPDKEDCQSLQRILGSYGWTVQGAQSVSEAANRLPQEPNLILCDQTLPDGNWQDVYRMTTGMDRIPAVVVAARNADEQLWAEVLNVGGFDLLLKPYEQSEVCRVLGMAWRHSALSEAIPA